MKKFCSIIYASIKNNLEAKSLVIVYIGIALICIVAIYVIADRIFMTAGKSAQGDAGTMAYYLGLASYIATLIIMGTNYCIFSAVPLAREKTGGTIESLLATPTSMKEIWLAKSLALFIPGLIVGIVFSFGSTVLINCLNFYPRSGFLLNPWLAVSTYIAIPVVCFCLSLLINLAGLAGRTTNGNIIASIFINAAPVIMINLAVRQVVDARSWTFVLVNFGLSGILLVLNFIFLPYLTKERIILSCRK